MCSWFYPNASDLNRNVPNVKSWVWKFKMFLKYHKDAILGKKRKIKDDTTVDCKKNRWRNAGEVVPAQLNAGPTVAEIYRWEHCSVWHVRKMGWRKKIVFVKGSAVTPVMRQDGIKYHEVSDRHKRAIEKKLAQTTPVHDIVAAKTLMSHVFYCCLELLSNIIKYIFSFRASTIWFGQVGY